MENFKYQSGGSLPLSSNTYIKRKSDEVLYDYIKASEYCYVFAPRQFGKSSMRVRISNRLEDEGHICTNIDLTSIGSTDIDAEKWYYSFLSKIAKNLKLKRIIFKKWWDENKSATLIDRFSQFIDEFAFKDSKCKLIIFIDEIDSLLNQNYMSTDDFFAVIRTFYNNRADDERYNNLVFILIGVATADDLMKDKTRTPFNISKAIYLQPLSLSDAKKILIKGLGGKNVDSFEILTRIFYWTGGHPYLTQKVCLEIQRKEVNRIKDIDKTIKEIFLDKKSTDHNIQSVEARILKQEKCNLLMLDILLKVLDGEKITIEPNNLVHIYLKLSGILSVNNKLLNYSNKIYKTMFNRTWINEVLEKIDRPFAKDLQRWIELDKVNSALLKGEVLNKASSWALKRRDLSNLENEYILTSTRIEQKEKLNDERKRFQSRTMKLLLVLLLAFIAFGIAIYFNLQSANEMLKLEGEAKKNKIKSIQENLKLQEQKEKLLFKTQRDKLKLESLSNYASQDINIRLNRIEFNQVNKNEEYKHYVIPTTIDDNILIDKNSLKNFTVLDTNCIKINSALVQLILKTKKIDFDKQLWLNTLPSMSMDQKLRLFKVLQYASYCDEGKVYFKESNNEKAIILFTLGISKYPKKEEAYYLLGDLLFHEKKYKESLSIYSKIKSKNVNFNLTIGIIYNELGDYAKALKQFNQIILEGKETDITYYHMGNSYYRQHNYKIAIKYYEHAIRINKNNDKAHNDLGFIYLEKLKKYKKAVESFTNATTANPKHYKAFNSMGLAYEKLYKYDKAIESFQKSIKANKEYEKPYIGLFKEQLFKGESFDKTLEEQYIDIFRNQKDIFMKYEMFSILQKLSKGQKIYLVYEWKQKYKNNYLKWRAFKELRQWAKREYKSRIKERLLKAIKIFERHKPEN